MHQTAAFDVMNITSITLSCLRSSSGLHHQLFILLQESLLICAPILQNTCFWDRIEVFS